MAELTVTIDASEIIKAYNKGFEDCFIAMSEFNDLESQLDINRIEIDEEH